MPLSSSSIKQEHNDSNDKRVSHTTTTTFCGLDIKYCISNEHVFCERLNQDAPSEFEQKMLPDDFIKKKLTEIKIKKPNIRFHIGCIEVAFVTSHSASFKNGQRLAPNTPPHLDYSIEIEIKTPNQWDGEFVHDRWKEVVHDMLCMWWFLSFPTIDGGKAPTSL